LQDSEIINYLSQKPFNAREHGEFQVGVRHRVYLAAMGKIIVTLLIAGVVLYLIGDLLGDVGRMFH